MYKKFFEDILLMQESGGRRKDWGSGEGAGFVCV